VHRLQVPYRETIAMNTDIGALTTIFSEFYYWITMPLMFLIHGECAIPSATSTAHPRSFASR
jgi:hypothetical protein